MPSIFCRRTFKRVRTLSPVVRDSLNSLAFSERALRSSVVMNSLLAVLPLVSSLMPRASFFLTIALAAITDSLFALATLSALTSWLVL